jgi:hypothetical protein
MASPGEQLWEVRLEHAEPVAPQVTHDPEVKAALLLVVPAGRAQRLQASDLSLNIIRVLQPSLFRQDRLCDLGE